ncbi:glycosyltransferase family 4 protein [Corallococcus carmarthensis]|uniref:Glycosyltransferase family 1 protein n=1 Tax=Corallococcus carmarthensis TaxID=2316728 RepID=A0A3A8K9E7_9BACT|nr:glycosyltransferase family 4 protein [Corallococcus carmarthensis]NOK20581.1 glycosyltransferase family 4 protein [Corallococcus carmarthensis]RKH00975.1 glycosyltransferase family 1 protein [Corallococcus carmarthensis]
MTRPRKLVTVSHSYVVTLNRRLANEMTRVGAGRWDITAVAPRAFHGDLGPLVLQRDPSEPVRIETVRAFLSRSLHGFVYGPELRAHLSRGVDLVHSWEEPYVLSGLEVALLTPRRVPLVFCTAQNLIKHYPPPFAQAERFVVHRASGWVAWGQTVRDTLQARGGYPLRPSRFIPMGVDVERFQPDAAAGEDFRRAQGWTPQGPPVVGYLGRFVPEKGVRLLMDALDGLRTPWRALFVGGGPMEATLREWATRHGDQVRVVTGVPHASVPQTLNAMDVLCAPSQTTPRWKEQFGRMLAEAFACGVPVLGSDSGEVPFTVGDAGHVLPEADTAAWTTTLGDLLENPATRQEWARKGLTRARTHFAWPVVARAHLDFFEEVLQGRA